VTLRHNIFVSSSLLWWFTALHDFDTLKVQVIPSFTVFCYMSHAPDEQCLVNLQTARLVTGKGFKVLSYGKDFCLCAKSLMFQRHAATRISDLLLSVTEIQGPIFKKTPSLLSCARFTQEWIKYLGCAPLWRGYRVGISCFAKVHSSTTLSNTVCLTLVVTS